MSLNLIHSRLAFTVLLYYIALMIWAIWRFLRKQGVNASFRGAMVISGLIILIQSAIGGLL